MSPITHGLISWIVADQLLNSATDDIASKDARQRDLLGISLAGVLCDLDGMGIVIDGYNRLCGNAASDYYTAGHHVVLHGIFGCVMMAALAWGLSASRSAWVFLLGLLTAHIHLVCDLVGSRGAGADEIWPIVYAGPWGTWGEVQWAGQWRLDSWQNVIITVPCLGWCFHKAWRDDCSPLQLLSKTAHVALRQTMIARFGEPKALQIDRGYRREAENEQP